MEIEAAPAQPRARRPAVIVDGRAPAAVKSENARLTEVSLTVEAPTMFEHVVVYSPLRGLSPAFVQKLGLLYDRVTIPLPDTIRSGCIDWLTDLSQACEYTKTYLNALDTVYSDNTGFCRPLDMADYPALAMDSDAFRADFFRFLDGHFSDDEWSKLLNVGIDAAQDVLNFYITQDYLQECHARTGKVPHCVFPYRDSNGGGDAPVVQKIAEVLEIEAGRCALHSFELPTDPKAFGSVLNVSRPLETRYALMKHLADAAAAVHEASLGGTQVGDVKALLRQHAVGIADSYNAFVEDLERYSDHVKVFRCQGTNALRIARKRVRLKWKVAVEAKVSFLKVMLNQGDEYTIQYRELLKEVGEALLTTQHRWQCDLLTFRCDADREFGRRETYKQLTQPWGYFELLRSKLK